MKNRQKLNCLGLACILIAVLPFTGCKKEVAGVNDNIALNFYSASDVMSAISSPARATTAIYLDEVRQQNGPIINNSNLTFPYFTYGYSSAPEYPSLIRQGQINYARFNAGRHRLYFTDPLNTVVVDTLIKPQLNSYYCIYLADAPGNNAKISYRAVAVAEDRTDVPTGKVGVRFIHLSPDAGDLTVSLSDPSGNAISAIPGLLKYPAASGYQFFDATGISGGVLHFNLSNKATGANINTGIPFSEGQRYVIVITGFLKDQQRQAVTGKNADGSLVYNNITVAASLRAELRTAY
nr:DUF4397 domain-containing protein [Pedobacter sp. ASV19]